MNLQPTLENDLVLVRPLSSRDFDDLYKAASDPAIWEQHTTTNRWLLDGFKTYFDDAIQSEGAFVIIDKATNIIIGSSRYHIEAASNNAVEIGWTFLSRAYWGGGYNRAFKSLMINHALKYKKNVLFLIAHDNLRSQKATEKLGGVRLFKSDHGHLIRKDNTHFTYLIDSVI